MSANRFDMLHIAAGIAALLASSMAPGAFAVGDGGIDFRTRVVDCARTYGGIQGTIDRLVLEGPVTIYVRGECRETVTVTRDDLTLASHWLGGMVDGTIDIVGAQRVVVDGLTVTGAGDGISVSNNASATIRNAVLENNGRNGVTATRGALVILQHNEIGRNAAYGIIVSDGANAQIEGGNTIESDVADWLATGSAIGGYRHATIHITGDGNVVRNNAMSEVEPSPPEFLQPPSSGDNVGFAIDVEHNSSFRQDQGRATIVGHIEIFNLSSADFRGTDLTGHIFVDGLSANVRARDAVIVGGMTMSGEANFRSNVDFTGDIYCQGNFLNPAILDPDTTPPGKGRRIDCGPEIYELPPPDDGCPPEGCPPPDDCPILGTCPPPEDCPVPGMCPPPDDCPIPGTCSPP